MKKTPGKPSLQIYRPPVFRGKSASDETNQTSQVQSQEAAKNTTSSKTNAAAACATSSSAPGVGASPPTRSASTAACDAHQKCSTLVETTNSPSSSKTPQTTQRFNAPAAKNSENTNSTFYTNSAKPNMKHRLASPKYKNERMPEPVEKLVTSATHPKNQYAGSLENVDHFDSSSPVVPVTMSKPEAKCSSPGNEPIPYQITKQQNLSQLSKGRGRGRNSTARIVRDKQLVQPGGGSLDTSNSNNVTEKGAAAVVDKTSRIEAKVESKTAQISQQSTVVRVEDGRDMNITQFNLKWFPSHLIPHVRTIIADPGSVDKMLVGEVAKLIINVAMNHVQYSVEAVMLCKYISRKEGDSSFKLTLIACLQQLYGNREKYRQANRHNFIAYILLLKHMYIHMRELSAQMLWDHLFDCMLTIVKSQASTYHENE